MFTPHKRLRTPSFTSSSTSSSTSSCDSVLIANHGIEKEEEEGLDVVGGAMILGDPSIDLGGYHQHDNCVDDMIVTTLFPGNGTTSGIVRHRVHHQQAQSRNPTTNHHHHHPHGLNLISIPSKNQHRPSLDNGVVSCSIAATTTAASIGRSPMTSPARHQHQHQYHNLMLVQQQQEEQQQQLQQEQVPHQPPLLSTILPKQQLYHHQYHHMISNTSTSRRTPIRVNSFVSQLKSFLLHPIHSVLFLCCGWRNYPQRWSLSSLLAIILLVSTCCSFLVCTIWTHYYYDTTIPTPRNGWPIIMSTSTTTAGRGLRRTWLSSSSSSSSFGISSSSRSSGWSRISIWNSNEQQEQQHYMPRMVYYKVKEEQQRQHHSHHYNVVYTKRASWQQEQQQYPRRPAAIRMAIPPPAGDVVDVGMIDHDSSHRSSSNSTYNNNKNKLNTGNLLQQHQHQQELQDHSEEDDEEEMSESSPSSSTSSLTGTTSHSWKHPYDEDHGPCIPMEEWQTQTYLNCNSFHELSLMSVAASIPLALQRQQQQIQQMKLGIVQEEELENTSEDKNRYPKRYEEHLSILGQGWFRTTWRFDRDMVVMQMMSEQQNQEQQKSDSKEEMSMESVVLKTLRIDRDYRPEYYDLHRRDAVAMEHLTASKFVVNVYGYCGNSAINELANFPFAGVQSLEVFDRRLRGSTSKQANKIRLRMAASVAVGVADIHYGPSSWSLEDDTAPVRASMAHYDLNPRNVALFAGGLPKINDFNIAEFLRYNPITNQTCGFPARMHEPWWRAPEEVSLTKYRLVDEKVDVYALGNVLFHMLTTRSPRGKMKRERMEEVRPLVALGIPPELPEDYANDNTDPSVIAIRRAMELCHIKDPTKRATSREVATLLLEALNQVNQAGNNTNQ